MPTDTPTATSTDDTLFDRPVPIRTGPESVAPEWIDYNGHMNVAYYTMAFDRALDAVYDAIGIGPELARTAAMGPMALQTQIHYLGELVEDEEYVCDTIILDADAKRVHVFVEMRKGDGSVAATYESLTMNVDLTARRSAPFPERAAGRLARLKVAHSGLPRPDQVGAPIGIRRR